MKIICVVVLLCITLACYAQMDELTFRQSILEDDFFCKDRRTVEEYCKCIDWVFNKKVITSKIIKGETKTPRKLRGRLLFYSIQLYEMSSGDYKWIMLRFESLKSSSYYRIRGYKENDFSHFYNRVLKYLFVGNNNINQEIKYWQEEAVEFRQIDFDCLIKAAKKNKTEYPCLKANVYIKKADNIVESTDEEGRRKSLARNLYDKVYSRFSNRPFLGSLPY